MKVLVFWSWRYTVQSQESVSDRDGGTDGELKSEK